MTSSKNNIKHKTLENYNTNTLETKNGIEFARASKEELEAEFLAIEALPEASGLGCAVVVTSQRESGSVIAPTTKMIELDDIYYAKLDLGKPKKRRGSEKTTQRQKVNLDFTLLSGKFNKLGFKLTWKPSELLVNIPESEHQHPVYQQALDYFRAAKVDCSNVWIAKGVERKFIKGRPGSGAIKPYTAMVMHMDDVGLGGRVWIENARFDFLFDTDIENNEYYELRCEPIKVARDSWGKTGGWL